MDRSTIDSVITKLAAGYSHLIKRDPSDPESIRLLGLCNQLMNALLSISNNDKAVSFEHEDSTMTFSGDNETSDMVADSENIEYIIERIITTAPELNTILLAAIEDKYPQYAERLKKLMALS